MGKSHIKDAVISARVTETVKQALLEEVADRRKESGRSISAANVVAEAILTLRKQRQSRVADEELGRSWVVERLEARMRAESQLVVDEVLKKIEQGRESFSKLSVIQEQSDRPLEETDEAVLPLAFMLEAIRAHQRLVGYHLFLLSSGKIQGHFPENMSGLAGDFVESVDNWASEQAAKTTLQSYLDALYFTRKDLTHDCSNQSK